MATYVLVHGGKPIPNFRCQGTVIATPNLFYTNGSGIVHHLQHFRSIIQIKGETNYIPPFSEFLHILFPSGIF